MSVSRPCLFAFDKASTELRRPNVKGIMMAKRKVIETVSTDDLGINIGESQVNIDSHDSPPEKPLTEIRRCRFSSNCCFEAS